MPAAVMPILCRTRTDPRLAGSTIAAIADETSRGLLDHRPLAEAVALLMVKQRTEASARGVHDQAVDPKGATMSPLRLEKLSRVVLFSLTPRPSG